MIRRFRAELFLIASTVLWGGTFPAITVLLQYADPAWIVGLRFAISAAAILPFVLLHRSRSTGSAPAASPLSHLQRALRPGIILALLTFGGFFLQTLGLAYTTPARSAFITQMLLIYVILFQVVLTGKRPTRWNLISSAILLTGAWVLMRPGEEAINLGDMITFLSAGAFAAYIVQIGRTSARGNLSATLFVQFTTTSVLGMAIALVRGGPAPVWTATSVSLLLYLAVPASLFTTWAMLRFQPETTPVRASILYALEPVFATLITIVYPGIYPAPLDWVGGGIILLGVIVSELSGWLTEQPHPHSLTTKE